MTANDKDAARSLDDALRPGHTALLIHDMQNDFCKPGGKIFNRAAKHPELIAAVIEQIAGLARAARTGGAKVVHLQQMHLANAADIPAPHVRHLKESGLAGTAEDIPCITGTWGHAMVDELTPEPGDIVIEKAAFNDFHNSMVDKVLRIQGVETAILTGVSSHAGVIGTTYGLIDCGYDFFIPREAVAGYDPELHEAAMKIMASHAVSIADIIGVWT